MRPLYSPAIFSALPRKQRGVALMVMLVIMVIGAATILVSLLNSSAITINRQTTSAEALAQAQDALLSFAVMYNDYPGSMPCPDTNDDGEADAGGTTGCPQYIGRLPWKTLGLPDLRDAAGERLWYTLSRNVRRYASVRPLNSETPGTLNITGNYAANNLYAIVFAPNNTLADQNRATSQTALCSTTGTTIIPSHCASNYLEGSNANKSTEASPVAGVNPNPNYLANLASSTFNDQLIFITKQQLFSTIEKRIGRETKVCLDGYAAANSNKYPWAVPVSPAPTSLQQSQGNTGTLFGRFATLTPAQVDDMRIKLELLQVAINNFAVSNTSANYTAMVNASNQAENSADAVDSYYDSSNPARDAAKAMADAADNISDLNISATAANISAAQQALTTKINNFNNLVPNPWPNCTLFTSSYWNDWKNLVFYQIANGFKPGGSGLCTGGGNCLSVQGSGHSNAGSGNYRAVVVVAGEKLTATRTVTAAGDYLEAINLLPSNNSAQPYITYQLADDTYQSINDLVLCVDNKVNCL